jgi:hypothetical protein
LSLIKKYERERERKGAAIDDKEMEIEEKYAK